MIKATPVHAEPQKNFFIDMLTRDIGLLECILDLIDNSIHNLIRTSNADVMRQLTNTKHPKLPGTPKISISLSESEFTIIDNCGGISRSDAVNDVFLFGHKRATEPKPGLGLYGVGMKRAFFKLGGSIEVVSRTQNDSFRVPIDVEAWRKSQDWTFDLYDVASDKRLPKPGVAIKVFKLYAPISKRLGSSGFEAELSQRIGSAYSLFLSAGLSISVNGKGVVSDLPEFETKAAKPARREFKFGDVSALIVVGLTPKNHRRPEGWYVFCNGRLILPRDQTSATGWGVDQFPQFHSKYNHFLGTIYFMSTHLEKLPWTTTKREINLDSSVYQKALTEMKILARPVLNELAKLYPTDRDDEAIVQREIFMDSKATPVTRLSRQQTIFSLTKPKKESIQEVSISYKKPKSQVDKVKSALGSATMSNKDVGERTFEYFLERECE